MLFQALSALLLFSSFANADKNLAPPDFGEHVYSDFIKSSLTVKIDAEDMRFDVHAIIEFQTYKRGKPLFDLRASIDGYEINGTQGKQLLTVEPPRRNPDTPQSILRSLNEALDPGKHTLTLSYKLTSTDTQKCRHLEDVIGPLPIESRLYNSCALNFFFSDTNKDGKSIDFFTELSDYDAQLFQTDGRTFWERYFPSGLEHDAFEQTMEVSISGTGVEHKLIANGEVITPEKNKFQVKFPPYLRSSAIFLHVLDPNRYFIHEIPVSINDSKTVPVTIYGLKAYGIDEIEKAVEIAVRSLKDFSEEIGFYLHPSLTILVSKNTGMEYSGAAISPLDSIPHELMHSWFGRGVYPANGAAGWIDEAITTWWVNKNGELSQSSTLDANTKMQKHTPLNWLGNPYERMTSVQCYRQGVTFMSQVASIFEVEKIALKPILIEFLQAYSKQSVTTEIFLDFLRKKAPATIRTNLEEAIQCLVFAK